jgi:ABC-type uncharacterized transport system substrate-binding protein
MWNAFRKGLRDLGYLEGQNIAFEYRYADGQLDRLGEVAAELVRRPVDVIATYGTPPTLAAKQATRTTPIVMIGVGDPVRAGLVATIPRPGGNVTGNTILGPEVAAKRLQLFKEAIPSISRLGFLVNPANASTVAYFEELQLAAPVLGVKLIAAEVRSVNDFESAFATIMSDRPNAFMMTADPLLMFYIGRVVDFLTSNRLPGMFQNRDNVIAGGLMSYGASLPDLFRQGAAYVHKILHGTKPADLPVELPTKFDLAVNLKTARALGLDVPPMLLARADEVIE